MENQQRTAIETVILTVC